MKFSLVVVLTMMVLCGYSQAEFSWGVDFYPNFSHRRLIAQTFISDSLVNVIEEREVPRLSYSAGLIAQWRGQRAGFLTGLRFMDTGYRTIRLPIAPDEDAPAGATEKREVFQNFNLEVPAELQFYQEIDQNNDLFFMFGFSAAYNLSNFSKTVYYTGENREVRREERDNSNFNSLLFSFLAGIGWEHAFTERLSIIVQPNFQFWMGGLLKETDINRNLYSVGLRTAVKFR